MSLSIRDSGYEDQGPNILGVSVGLMSFAFLLVIVRVGYRLRSSGVRTDDYLIAAAVIFALGHSINDCISVVYYGYGKHEADLSPAQKAAGKATGAALGFFITQIFYKMSLMCTKLSICFLYRRIFERARKSFNTALWTVTGLIFCYYLAGILATIFECTPVSKSWMKTEPGTCVNISTFFFANAAFNILTDVVIIVLPVPIIYDLHLPLRQKIMLCCIFAVGLFATATSVIRIFTLAGTEDADTTWGVSPSVLWSAAEINTAIVCACLPMLRPPLQALFPRLFRTANSRSGEQYASGYGGNRPGQSSSGKWNGSSNRASKRLTRHGAAPDPNSLTLVMDDFDMKDKPQTTSDKSSDDEPYFIDRDEDSTGILKRTDVTIVYEGDGSEGSAQHEHQDQVDAGHRSSSDDHIEALPKLESDMPGRAL